MISVALALRCKVYAYGAFSHGRGVSSSTGTNMACQPLLNGTLTRQHSLPPCSAPAAAWLRWPPAGARRRTWR